MALPVNVRDVVRSTTKLVSEREQPVRLAVLAEIDAPDALIDALRDALRPATSAATLGVDVAEPGRPYVPAPGTDAVIVIAGSGGSALGQALAAVRGARVPVVVVSLGDAATETALASQLSQPTADIIVGSSPSEVVERLGSWMAERLASRRLALAHNFAFVRRAVAEDAVRTTAWQNALVGTVTPIPGADMPIMTANQIKMLLQIAAAYGEPLGAERVKELAAVVAGGYVFRAIARQALAIVPVLGGAVKGGVAYTGTIAMGRAAIAYFEQGADLGYLTERLREIRDRAAAKRGPEKVSVPATQLELPVTDDGGAGA
jgi:uncharacterized protein (DUF697 family)